MTPTTFTTLPEFHKAITTVFTTDHTAGSRVICALADVEVPAGHTLSIGDRVGVSGYWVTLLHKGDDVKADEDVAATIDDAIVAARRMMERWATAPK